MKLTRRHMALAALGLPAACASPPPPPAPPAPAPYRAARRIALPPATAFAFSSDDQNLLVGSDEQSRMNTYAQAVEGEARVILTGHAAAHADPISYFPTDERVLLRVMQGGRAHIFVRGIDGALRDLTPQISMDADFLGWRANGGAFFVIAVRDGGSTAYTYDASSYSPYALYDSTGRIDAISGDGRWLAFTSAEGIFVVSLDSPSADPRRVAATPSSGGSVFEFARDGRSLVYANSERGEHIEAWRYDLATGAHTPVMQTQADVLAITSAPSGRYRVYATGADGAINDVLVVDQQTDRAFPLSAGIRDVRFSRDERRIAHRRADDDWPNDIFVSDLNGENMRRVVHALAAGQ